MRRFIAIAVAVLCAYVVVRRVQAPRVETATATSRVADNGSIARAFATHARDVRVDGDGVVSRVLPDDNQGDRHQRFLVQLPSGQTILIAHNIDIAPRVENLRIGDEIAFEGEYVWNAQGGVVHWTHHDPSARHKTGWLRHAGRLYR